MLHKFNLAVLFFLIFGFYSTHAQNDPTSFEKEIRNTTNKNATDLKILQEQVESLIKDVDLQTKQTEKINEIKFKNLKDTIIMQTKEIDNRYMLILKIGGAFLTAIAFIVTFLSYKTIVKWIQIKIEAKMNQHLTDAYLEILFRDKGDAAINRIVEDIEKQATERLLLIDKLKENYEDLIRKITNLDAEGGDVEFSEDFIKELESFEKNLKKIKNPDNYNSNDWLAVGRSEHINGNYTDAIRSYNLSISLDKQNSKAYRFRAITYFAMNQIKKAFRDIKYSLSLDKESSASWIVLGGICARQKMFDKAVIYYKKAAEFNPTSTAICINLTEIHIYEGDYTKAVEMSQKGYDLAKNENQKAISLFFMCLSNRLKGNNTSVFDKKFDNLHSKAIKVFYYFDDIDNWIETVNIDTETENYILDKKAKLEEMASVKVK